MDPREHPRAGGPGRPPAPAWFAGAPATLALIVLCTGLYLAGAVTSRSIAHNLAAPAMAAGMLYGPAVPQGAGWLRIVSGPLLHDGPGHLLSNMLLLGLVGPQVERFWGTARFAALTAVTALGSSAAVLWWTPEAPTVGISGALLGIWLVFGAQLAVVDPRQLRGIAVLVVVTLCMPILIGGISWSGHLGGLLTGLPVALGWWRILRAGPPVRGSRLSLVLAAVAALVIAALVLWWAAPPAALAAVPAP
ncbi:rhomboid family intramembrane serine protease [Corynebacterium sphenisci]|uniref:rhomboid family intramembrane serine protease n=1 Tax=Corynebacterium sphenisci TaxID=191493 RepID=UPI0026E030F7|nr:rhomboid family intramembrane serine protease [Corynebacterium sphenisci]MDO5731970.1 rhomboid family intramembrane serine protease [Corynebacterium sphenisci]